MEYYVPISIILAVIFSHVIKEIIHVYTHKEFSWYVLLLKTGGMPSSHSAAVSALTLAIYFVDGLSILFWACFVFSAVIIRDAFGVRKSVSDQATMINVLLGKAEIQEKVHIVLGHTPIQVFTGIIIGILSALIVSLF